MHKKNKAIQSHAQEKQSDTKPCTRKTKQYKAMHNKRKQYKTMHNKNKAIQSRVTRKDRDNPELNEDVDTERRPKACDLIREKLNFFR